MPIITPIDQIATAAGAKRVAVALDASHAYQITPNIGFNLLFFM